MRRIIFGLIALGFGAILITSPLFSQPPGGDKGGKGPPRFELGTVLPPPILEELNLTPEQEKALEQMKADLKVELEKLLTPDQKKMVENFRPMGPGGGQAKKGGPGGKGGNRPNVPSNFEITAPPLLPTPILVKGPLQVVGGKSPIQLTGDAVEGVLGNYNKEVSGTGIRFLSGQDLNKDGEKAGNLSFTVKGLNNEKGRWYRILVRGLAQDNFAVEDEELYIKVEYFKEDGKNALDYIKKSIYAQLELERKSFKDPGTNKSLGAATWRNYSIDFRTPFPEVDTLKISVGFNKGAGKSTNSEFWISELEVLPIPDPANYTRPTRASNSNPPALKSLVSLGGRWYYDPRNGGKEIPKQFDSTNVDQLYYLADKLETPFVNNTTSWLRRGYLDYSGKLVEKDQFVSDSLVILFTEKFIVLRSKNLPNHPTAVFPDRTRYLDGNPNYIQEQRDVWRIPLQPKENPKHVAMTMKNTRALPMGPIGVAVNGVVFFNPFDESAEVDAVWRLDRCCGHPSPSFEYHYHKYPSCVNTPWADDGADHSTLIGFAFDGYPVYGPYESKGVLAKDSKEHPLNEFNLHSDPLRGPHYHVTPGKFPHIIGGYWGEVDPSTRGKKGPPKQ